MKKLALFFCVAVLFMFTKAEALETPASHVLLMDYQTGEVLFEKNGHDIMYPSSMTKMMLTHIIFEKLKSGALSLDDEVTISEKAWKKGGSKMFVEVGNQVRVEDLLRGIIVQSGNDASIAMAEALAGTEEAFAEMMNQSAKEMGMNDSHFMNSTGWPDPEHVTSAHDLALLAYHTIKYFPEYYHYYNEREFTYNKIKQGNRNPLLYSTPGADGLKTGHTEAAGYGLTASAEREGRRLILVVNGLGSIKERAEESAKLMEWGFRNFTNIKLFARGDVIDTAPVWLGEKEEVALTIENDVILSLPRADKGKITSRVEYTAPLSAPIATGQHVGKLIVSIEGHADREFILVAGESVEKLSGFGRVWSALRHLIWGPATS